MTHEAEHGGRPHRPSQDPERLREELLRTRIALAGVQAQRREDVHALAGAAAYLVGVLDALPPEAKAQAEAAGGRRLAEIVQAQEMRADTLVLELLGAASQSLWADRRKGASA